MQVCVLAQDRITYAMGDSIPSVSAGFSDGPRYTWPSRTPKLRSMSRTSLSNGTSG